LNDTNGVLELWDFQSCEDEIVLSFYPLNFIGQIILKKLVTMLDCYGMAFGLNYNEFNCKLIVPMPTFIEYFSHPFSSACTRNAGSDSASFAQIYDPLIHNTKFCGKTN
jgi:hypothetical protein